MFKAKVTIVGTAPLLQNRFPDEQNPENKSKKKQKVYVDKDEAEMKLYKDKSGKICQPANHFEACMIKTSTGFKFEGKKTYKDAFKGGLFVNPMMIPHKYPKYEIDRQPVVIQRSRVMRARPRFDKWELSFEIECIDDRISPDVVEEVLKTGGLYTGVGDLRPRYGRFEVTSFKVVK